MICGMVLVNKYRKKARLRLCLRQGKGEERNEGGVLYTTRPEERNGEVMLVVY